MVHTALVYTGRIGPRRRRRRRRRKYKKNMGSRFIIIYIYYYIVVYNVRPTGRALARSYAVETPRARAVHLTFVVDSLFPAHTVQLVSKNTYHTHARAYTCMYARTHTSRTIESRDISSITRGPLNCTSGPHRSTSRPVVFCDRESVVCFLKAFDLFVAFRVFCPTKIIGPGVSRKNVMNRGLDFEVLG